MSKMTAGRLDQIDTLPEEALVPVGWVREIRDAIMARRVTLAVERKLTVDMWVEIARRSMTSVPEEAWGDDSGATRRESRE